MSITRPRSGNVERALTEEQREDFLAFLRTIPDVTGKQIKRLCLDRYGIKIGKTAAHTFINGPFKDYLAKLRSRRVKQVLIKEAQEGVGDGVSDAEAAGADLAEALQQFTSEGGLDAVDLTDPNGIKSFANLTLAAKRLRSDDRAREESAQKIKRMDLEIEKLRSDLEAQRTLAANAAKAVDQLTRPKALGLSIAARNAIRLEQGLPPLEEVEAA